MHLFQLVVGGMHRSRPLAGSSAHAPFPAVAVGGINNVAAIQPAVGGGAVVAAPAVGGLAPAIGAGGGWRLPPRQQWRWRSGGQPGASACQEHSPVPDVLGGGIRPMHIPATIP